MLHALIFIGTPNAHFRFHKRYFIWKPERLKGDWGPETKAKFTILTHPLKILGEIDGKIVIVSFSRSAWEFTYDIILAGAAVRAGN